MKTVIEWINTIEDKGIKSELLCNVDNSELHILRKLTSLRKVIECSFVWDESPQGQNFWYEIAKALYKNENPE